MRRTPPSSFEIEEISDLDAVGADVCSLFDVAENEDFQGGLDWYRLLAGTTTAPNQQATMAVLRSGGCTVAALPLLATRDGGITFTALSNCYSSRFVAPMRADASASGLAQLIARLREHRPRPASLSLAPMDRDDTRRALLREAMSQAGLVPFDYFCFGNWHLPTDTFRGACDHYLATRPGELRSTLRRMSRRFSADGGHIEIICSANEAERATAAFTSVYARSWKTAEPHPGFVPALIRLCAKRGWLRMGVAWLNGQAVAAQLWVVCGRRASIFKLAYDERQARYSPGTLLTAALMRQVLDHDLVEEVDFMTGDDAYKPSWMTRRRERWGLIAYDPRSFTGSWLLARETTARLGKAALSRLRPPGGSPRQPHTVA